MDLGLRDKVAIVTGGSRGIGKGIALGLAEEGCHIVTCARHVDELQKAAHEIREKNVEVLALPMDITHTDNVEQLVDQAMEKFERIDILVNNVGGNRRGEFTELSDQDWEDIIHLNLLSHVRMSRAVIPYMKQQGQGVILFISSIFGREAGGAGLSIYNATKSGVISMAKILALELAAHNIRVNSIAPGSIRFPGGSWDERYKKDPEAMEAWVRREIPIGRFGTVKEVANVAVFLASEKASLVTGACVNVDGGQSHSLI
ncbi:MAG: SDR family oxidoreductase [Calditrichaeota bacterium]|nr:MAG: SDR family oxidoreductase [Calditrichota bacterium]